MRVTHRLGVVGVPRDEVGRRVVGLVATSERYDERPLDRRGTVRARARRRDLLARLLERSREVDRVERLPLLVDLGLRGPPADTGLPDRGCGRKASSTA
jgi:hypothetical protein